MSHGSPKGLRLFPGDARFYAEYGKVLLLPWAAREDPGAEAKGESLLRQAIQRDGSLAVARFELGSLLVKSGRAAESVPHLEKAVQLDAGNAQAHFALSRAYRAVGRTEDAEREAEAFRKLERR